MIHATGGKLRTKVGIVLPLANAGEAHFMLQGVRIPPKGKIMLAVGPSCRSSLVVALANPDGLLSPQLLLKGNNK
jgi:hypothetical protein